MVERNFLKIRFWLDISCLAVFLIVPFYFGQFFLKPFPIAWQISFYGCLLFCFFFWVLEVINSFFSRKGMKQDKKFSLSNKDLFLAVVPFFIFIVVNFLSSLFSEHSLISFWGSYERGFGFLTWLFLFLFYCFLIFNLKTKDQLVKIIGVIIGVNLFVCLYGLLQLTGFDFIQWSEEPVLTKRVFSTLGQPNFLGSWLVLTMPLIFWSLVFALLKAIKEKKSFLVVLPFLFLFLLNIFILIFTQSRGAWLGFFGQIFFVFLFLLYYFRKKRAFYIFLSLSLLTFVLLFLYFIFVLFHFQELDISSLSFNQSDENTLEARISSLANLGGATGRLRLFFWRDAIDLVLQKPILGYGLENQRFYYLSYYRPEFAVLEAINHYPDRAHNEIFDVLLTSGVLGLVSYLFFLIISFYLGLKRSLKNLDFSGSIVLALLIGVFGYLVSLLFSFHIIPTAVYFVGFLALINCLSLKNYAG